MQSYVPPPAGTNKNMTPAPPTQMIVHIEFQEWVALSRCYGRAQGKMRAYNSRAKDNNYKVTIQN